jgi:hypothetical protein
LFICRHIFFLPESFEPQFLNDNKCPFDWQLDVGRSTLLNSKLAVMNPPPLPVRKRFPWILYWTVLALIILVALAPMGSVVACGLIADANGCKVDEGSVHPCIINGQDYGHLLYTLGVLGWLMLVTLPAGVFAFVIWLIILILHRESWRKRVAAGLIRS